MYIETSSPRIPGEKAKLLVSVPSNWGTSCLLFYYHMYGATVGTLNVYSGSINVFNISGNQGNTWMGVKKTIYLYTSVSIAARIHLTSYSFFFLTKQNNKKNKHKPNNRGKGIT